MRWALYYVVNKRDDPAFYLVRDVGGFPDAFGGKDDERFQAIKSYKKFGPLELDDDDPLLAKFRGSESTLIRLHLDFREVGKYLAKTKRL